MTRKNNKTGVSNKKPARKKNASAANKSTKANKIEEKERDSIVNNAIANNVVAMHVIPFILFIASVYILICFVIYSGENGMKDVGGIGVFSRNVFYGLLGSVAVLVPFFTGSIAFFLRRDLESGFFKYRLIFSVSCLVLYAAVFHLASNASAGVGYNAVRLFDNGKVSVGGGIFGGFLAETLRKCVGNVGAWIFVISLSIVFSVFLFGRTPVEVVKGIIKLVREYQDSRRKGFERRILVRQKDFNKDRRRFKTRTHKYRIASNVEVLQGNSKPRANNINSDNQHGRFQVDIPFGGDDAKEPSANSADYIVGKKKRLIDIGGNPFEKKNSGNSENGGNSENIGSIANDVPVMIPGREFFDNRNNADVNSIKPDNPVKDCDKIFDGFDNEPEVSGENINNITNELGNLEIVESAPQIRGDEPEVILETSKVFEDENKKPSKKEYKLPPLSYLTKDTNSLNVDISEESSATAKKLIDTLASFGVKTNIYRYSRGPSITRYEIVPDAGVKVNSIENLVKDISLNLAADVRIESPIPGKSAIGVEVPNKNREIVHLRALLEEPQFTNAASKITIALGMDVAGNPIYSDIAKMPHLLIAGATGMGKSVCINSILTSILYKATPDEVKLILIDPKKVELNIYNGIPHLFVPVVSDPKKAAGSLSWAVNEMENRYMLIEEKGVRDLKSYNEEIADDPFAEPLPQIVIVIDELADLMLTAPADVEQSINRLAAKARAAGIHLIVGTQRPSVDVVTGLIKANIPARIAFTVASQVDSRTIINIAGAEKLIGYGDMLYLPIGVTKPIRVQGAFVGEKDFSKVAEFWKKQSDGEYDANILSEIEQEAARCNTKGAKIQSKDDDSSADDELEKEPMLKSAIEIAIDMGTVSTSLLQRKLALGYARAARIVDKMEKMNIIGPFEGSKPRKVLITRQDFVEMTMNKDLE
ncbi:MAG: DNA translocase FtsK [Oscillospiraceae bacterium]|nr:DNA translocase FtsK [Oscillospiraceae bacterium]